MKEILKRLPVADQIRKGLEEAIRHAKGEARLKTTTMELPAAPPVLDAEDVIRVRLNGQMSQVAFARLLNVSPRTVQGWEQGTRKPSQAALRLIQVLELYPHDVFSAAGLFRPEASPPTRKRNTSMARNRRGSLHRSSKKPAI